MNRLQPARGRLLIAEPLMLDPFFKRTVVILCEFNPEGAFGFILNKYVDIDLNELVEDFPSFDGRLSLGGPVERDNLFYMHTLGDKMEGSFKITDDLFMGGNLDDLKSLLLTGQASASDVRFFVGYAGWDADQIASEMGVNSWIIGDANLIDPMDTEVEGLWEQVLNKMGGDFSLLTTFPEDPSLN